jgi:hypothetical protein
MRVDGALVGQLPSPVALQARSTSPGGLLDLRAFGTPDAVRGSAAQPSVQTSMARAVCAQARTCRISRSASAVSRVRLTVPASHKRVETIIAVG